MDRTDYIFLDGLNSIADAKIALEHISELIAEMRAIVAKNKELNTLDLEIGDVHDTNGANIIEHSERF